MNTLTQTLRRRQAVVEYAKKHGVTASSRRYNVSRPTIYSWIKRYDGELQSLKNYSRKPKHHPNEHTEEEVKLIRNMCRRCPHDGIVVLWVKLQKRGYTRSLSGLYKALRRLGDKRVKLPNPKKSERQRPYEQMTYPGQRVQIDVKFVPKSCIAEEGLIDGGFFQYTFIDEYSRFRILEGFKEHSTFSSAEFIRHCVQKFPYAIECVQTDNGAEFTNKLNSKKTSQKTLFENTLDQLCIRHKLIKVMTPRHNGKVERSHRKDNEYFYASHSFYSFEDFTKQLAAWQRTYNNFPMRPLGWKSPRDVLFSFPVCKV